MTTFYLTIKDNKKEVIAKVKAETLEQAVDYFSKVKNLSKEDILKVYTITE
jgi:hypothetical protein